jgi:hypothetical protein
LVISVATALVVAAGSPRASAQDGGKDPPLGRLPSPSSTEPEGRGEGEDDPLVTDRPSFTPSNVPVSRGRLVIESGYTFTHDLSAETEVNEHLFPEVGLRYGLCDDAELRVIWIGQTYSGRRPRAGGAIGRLSGVADTEISIGWEVSEQDGLVPQAMLITGVLAPTGGGGSSPFSGGGVQPLATLSYGWSLGERFSIAGSTGYSTLRRVGPDLMNADDSFQQFAQSLIASWAVTDRTTLFHEWFVLARVNSVDDRPENYMQAGALLLLTPNIQLDARTGIGLGDYTADFFTGAGLSIRY